MTGTNWRAARRRVWAGLGAAAVSAALGAPAPAGGDKPLSAHQRPAAAPVSDFGDITRLAATGGCGLGCYITSLTVGSVGHSPEPGRGLADLMLPRSNPHGGAS